MHWRGFLLCLLENKLLPSLYSISMHWPSEEAWLQAAGETKPACEQKEKAHVHALHTERHRAGSHTANSWGFSDFLAVGVNDTSKLAILLWILHLSWLPLPCFSLGFVLSFFPPYFALPWFLTHFTRQENWALEVIAFSVLSSKVTRLHSNCITPSPRYKPFSTKKRSKAGAFKNKLSPYLGSSEIHQTQRTTGILAVLIAEMFLSPTQIATPM